MRPTAIVADLVRATGSSEVVKVKSMATQEIGLNEALAAHGITAWETDLAELIVQLDDDQPSHILVPAIHRNRAEIREIFLRELPGVDPALTDDPAALAGASRRYLREKFLAARVAISGANFAVAETGTIAVVESEGNGRMCLTLPQTLITVMGIEKLVPTWRDLEVFLQLLPRSSTGERMNPYTSMWAGVHPGDGPQEFHLVLLDNGRTATLADPRGRTALRCIRCSACLNVCPVYERTGGHAYGSVYPGPIGAVLSPQLTGVAANKTLPFASSLCGACYDVCPVAIDIPSMLVHLRAEANAAATGVAPRTPRHGSGRLGHALTATLDVGDARGATGPSVLTAAVGTAAAVGLDPRPRPPPTTDPVLPRLVDRRRRPMSARAKSNDPMSARAKSNDPMSARAQSILVPDPDGHRRRGSGRDPAALSPARRRRRITGAAQPLRRARVRLPGRRAPLPARRGRRTIAEILACTVAALGSSFPAASRRTGSAPEDRGHRR